MSTINFELNYIISQKAVASNVKKFEKVVPKQKVSHKNVKNCPKTNFWNMKRYT